MATKTRECPKTWQHPIHAKGVKTSTLFGSHVRGPLTDKQIDAYVRQGFYGTEMQDALTTKKKPRRKNPDRNLVKRALALLGLKA